MQENHSPSAICSASDAKQSVLKVFHFVGNQNFNDPDLVTSFSPELIWTYDAPEGIPFAGIYRGPDQVKVFFQKLFSTATISTFRHAPPQEWVYASGKLFLTGRIAGRIHRSNGYFDSKWEMIWTFEEGLVARLEFICDPGAFLRALNQTPQLGEPDLVKDAVLV